MSRKSRQSFHPHFWSRKLKHFYTDSNKQLYKKIKRIAIFKIKLYQKNRLYWKQNWIKKFLKDFCSCLYEVEKKTFLFKIVGRESRESPNLSVYGQERIEEVEKRIYPGWNKQIFKDINTAARESKFWSKKSNHIEFWSRKLEHIWA